MDIFKVYTVGRDADGNVYPDEFIMEGCAGEIALKYGAYVLPILAKIGFDDIVGIETNEGVYFTR